jgi:CDP-diacylglycerol--glycerol-3-phosphate 3-phosphatidyltransferase
MKSSTNSEELTLTDRLRVYTEGIVEPIVTVLVRLKVSPDILTLTGMFTHSLFAWLIATGRMQLAGLAIAVISPLDGLDGALARKIGRQQGGFGAFLDSTSDRFAEVILFAGFGYYYFRQDDLILVAIAYMALTGSLLVSYTRSRAEALGLNCKVGLLTRVERYVILVATLVLNIPNIGLVILAAGTYFTFGQRIRHVWNQTRNSA